MVYIDPLLIIESTTLGAKCQLLVTSYHEEGLHGQHQIDVHCHGSC